MTDEIDSFADEIDSFAAACAKADAQQAARAHNPRSDLSWRQGTFSAEALQNETFPPLKWIVPNMIPAEGTSLLCSKPKFGKSWLVLDQAPPAAPHDEATSHIRGQVASASHHQDRVAPPARGWPYRYSGLAR